MQNNHNVYDDLEDVDGENEVSINLEDAIATAEELNKRQQIVDGLDDFQDDIDDDEEIANEIAGIVTDGHNQDRFAHQRLKQHQRSDKQNYDQEDEMDQQYDQEDQSEDDVA